MRVGDGYADFEFGEGLEGLVVEGGDRLALERDRRRPAVQGVDAQLMVDEVEVDGEDRVPVALAQGPGRDASAGEVKGHVPPVVAPHAGGQPNLPNDLAKPMQRLLGVLPGGQWHR